MTGPKNNHGHCARQQRAIRTSSLARLLLLIAVLLLGLTTLGCEPEEAEPTEPKLPPAVIDLPEVPADLGVSQIPERHPDGSYTVDGIRRNRQKHLDNKVRVKAYVVWVSKCAFLEEKKKRKPWQKAPKRKPDEPLPTCERPHLQIADAAGAEKNRMMVVKLDDYIQEQIDEEAIKVGGLYTFEGNYTDIGDSFAAVEEGLVVLDKVSGFVQPEDWKPKGK